MSWVSEDDEFHPEEVEVWESWSCSADDRYRAKIDAANMKNRGRMTWTDLLNLSNSILRLTRPGPSSSES